jgi:hypothetical protein
MSSAQNIAMQFSSKGHERVHLAASYLEGKSAGDREQDFQTSMERARASG